MRLVLLVCTLFLVGCNLPDPMYPEPPPYETVKCRYVYDTGEACMTVKYEHPCQNEYFIYFPVDTTYFPEPYYQGQCKTGPVNLY